MRIGIGLGLAPLRSVALYGPELVSNGNMETGSPPTDWAGSDATLTSVADERTGGSGSKSLNIALTAAAGAAIQDVTLEIGKTYHMSLWTKLISADHFTVAIYTGAWGMMDTFDPTAGATWAQTTRDFVAIDTTAHICLYAVGASGQSGRYDDVSIRKIA